MKGSLFGFASVFMVIASLVFVALGTSTSDIRLINTAVVTGLLATTFALWEIREQLKQ